MSAIQAWKEARQQKLNTKNLIQNNSQNYFKNFSKRYSFDQYAGGTSDEESELLYITESATRDALSTHENSIRRRLTEMQQKERNNKPKTKGDCQTKCGICGLSLSNKLPEYHNLTIIVPCAHRLHDEYIREYQRETGTNWNYDKGPHLCPCCNKVIQGIRTMTADEPWSEADRLKYIQQRDPRFIPISIEQIENGERDYKSDILDVVMENADEDGIQTVYKFNCEDHRTLYEETGIKNLEISASNIYDLWLKLYHYILTNSKNNYDLLNDDVLIAAISNGGLMSVKNVAEYIVTDFEEAEADIADVRCWIKDEDDEDEDEDDGEDEDSED